MEGRFFPVRKPLKAMVGQAGQQAPNCLAGVSFADFHRRNAGTVSFGVGGKFPEHSFDLGSWLYIPYHGTNGILYIYLHEYHTDQPFMDR